VTVLPALLLFLLGPVQPNISGSPAGKTLAEPPRSKGPSSGTGFETLRWGANVEEVSAELTAPEGIFQSTRPCELGEKQESCYLSAEDHQYRVVDRAPSLHLFFSKGLFSGVIMKIDRTPGETWTPAEEYAVYVKLRTALDASYGQPKTGMEVMSSEVLQDPKKRSETSWAADGALMSLSANANSWGLSFWLQVTGCVECKAFIPVGQQPFAKDLSWQKHALSRAFWQSMNWSRFPEAPLAKALPSAEVLPEKDRERFGGRIVNWGEKALDDIHLRLMVIRKEGPPKSYGFALMSEDEKRYRPPTLKHCDDVYRRLLAEFGAPTAQKDTSGPMGFMDWRLTSQRVQWDLGTSRVNWSCFAMGSEKGVVDAHLSLNAWPIAGYPKLKELIWIRCSQVIRISGIPGREQPEKKPDVVLVLDDEDKGAVYESNMSKVSGAEVSESRVTFKREDSKRTDAVTINRLSGEYLEDREVKGTAIKAQVTGTCEKVDPGQMKF